MSEPLRVRYLSFDDHSGYATAGRRAIRGLLDAGVSVTWTPLRWVPGGYTVSSDLSMAEPWLADLAHLDLDVDVAVLHAPPRLWKQWRGVLGPVPMVGATVWETSALPPLWVETVPSAAAVVVPSTFNIDLWARAGLSRPAVVPHCPTEPLAPPPRSRPDGITTFLTTGEWTSRKAVGDTIEAYLRAFTADDPVRLVVKTGAIDCTGRPSPGGGRLALSTSWAVTRLRARHERPARIDVITAPLDRAAMRDLWSVTDCFVSLTHSEGFGLGSFDAATHARPVIITGWGGQLDFLDPRDAFLVDHAVVPVDDPLAVDLTQPGTCWAEPSLDHAIDLLRAVVARPDEARERGVRLAARIADEFSAERSTQLLIDVLRRTVAPDA